MRLWSLHPKYLDAKGLVALWREGLLAQKVLMGKTKGYKHHPQLTRFRVCENPVETIRAYLSSVATEADLRGYRFDRRKIKGGAPSSKKGSIPVTRGQLQYEFKHLLQKLRTRDKTKHKALLETKRIQPHPLFKSVAGKVAAWEK